ncbi:MAG: beta-N-acetylhexosaminidase [Methylococcales bacterium]
MTHKLPPGSLMLDLRGLAVEAGEFHKLRHPGAGGVILFSRNFESPEQVADLVREIRAIRGHDFLIAVDQEGGRVQRFRNGFTLLPAACRYAEMHPDQQGAALKLAESAGWLMAAEVLATGIDFSFAPVLDVDCGISSIIGDRAFGGQPDLVADYASAFRRGMRTAGMAAVGKHFPGHGGVATDSHLALPVDDRSFDELAGRDLLPFRRLIGEGIEGIMPAHVVYSRIDEKPAGFSRYWIKQVLRGDLGFDGVVFSDDLSMSGAEFAGSYADRVKNALEAGCDIVLICNQPEAAESVLDLVAGLGSPSPESRSRLLKMCADPAFDGCGLKKSRQWQTAMQSIQKVANPRMSNLDEIKTIRAEADLLFSKQQVDQAFNRMAQAITEELKDSNPVVLGVLCGAIVPTAKLMQRLDFPLTCDAIHASRYQGQTSGSELEWISLPRTALINRTVLIVDDILDQGFTLEAISRYCAEQGAASVYSAVLVEKLLGHAKSFRADFVGLEAENRYLFGCGMDYKGYWRNLPGIYACKGL